LADAHTPEEVAQVLGKGRLVAYASVSATCALGCLIGVAVLASKVALHQASAWVFLALPALLFLCLFCGFLAYGGAYYLMTGRRWTGTEKINAFFGRLERPI
jgi:hypothetical protein